MFHFFWPLGEFLTKADQSVNVSNETFARGGYPNALELDSLMREKWYDNLLTTILERDVQELATISRPREMAKLLEILSLRTSNLLNLSEISRIASIPYTTLNHYVMLLESLFLIVCFP